MRRKKSCTHNGVRGRWEYAEALGKKICIYLNGIEIKGLPQFYWSYPILDVSQKISITKDGKQIDIKEWLEGK